MKCGDKDKCLKSKVERKNAKTGAEQTRTTTILETESNAKEK